MNYGRISTCSINLLFSATQLVCVFPLDNDDVFTVEDAVNKMGFGVFQLLVAFLTGFIWVRIYVL